ncbi:MAG: dihydropteroate synthase [Candidatus Nanopelagicales bacterium]|nr:dihydropteroate synthase [Candidatus Nanopelagicales bacterium]
MGLSRLDRCLVMGVLNVTPDSFSDGGRWDSVDAAIARGVELAGDGADIVDVGGESTRPGAQRVSGEHERDRVLPVVSALSQEGVCVSIDTMRASTATAAVAAGASIVNDVSGGLADARMLGAVADLTAPYVIMHWRAHSRTMDNWAAYEDVVSDVRSELLGRVEQATARGVAADRIVIDPGLGFAKDPGHNWRLLRRFGELVALGFPVLIGASRKRFIGELLAEGGEHRPLDDRDAATAALSALAAATGAWGVRVHEVSATMDAVKVARAWQADPPGRDVPASGPGL